MLVVLAAVASAAPGADPHAGRFDAIQGGCPACHPSARSKRIVFDHAGQTGWTHTHQQRFRCRDCHRGTDPTQFEKKNPGPSCGGCHAHATAHDNRFKPDQCADCHTRGLHSPRPIEALYHGAKSPFPLEGGHASVPCVDCHSKRSPKGRLVFEQLETQCSTCHADPHAGKQGPRCDTCHLASDWRSMRAR